MQPTYHSRHITDKTAQIERAEIRAKKSGSKNDKLLLNDDFDFLDQHFIISTVSAVSEL